MMPGVREYVLRDIFRILTATQEAEAERYDLGAMSFRQPIESLTVAVTRRAKI